MLLAASTVFIYYTIWALLLVRSDLCHLTSISHLSQPFFATSNPIHSYFPPREWAVRLPAFILVVGLTGIGIFVGRTIMKEREKQALKARMRAA
jgi:dolichyl-phosphate mannosyltransferase polypeptide 2 regulatory subunit